MKIGGVPYRAIFTTGDGTEVRVIDQTVLPHRFETIRLRSPADAARAIRDMVVRGAPLIGATAAYGVALAMTADPSDDSLDETLELLGATRPTAVNLRWALDAARTLLRGLPPGERAAAAYDFAAQLCEDDVRINRSIGEFGLGIFREIARRRAEQGRPAPRDLNVMTHCNAGWLATVDWGTATAPMYLAHDEGLRVHVWVRETRPRLQGAGLTTWELGQHGVPHTLVSDSAAGHLLSRGKVDLVIVGTDRTTAAGDVANKVGTYPLALAARDNGVPFYVAAPSPSIDWTIEDGASIPIEQRDPGEVTRVWGVDEDGVERRVRVVPEGTRAANYAFDVTPRRLVTGLVTERGVCEASRAALARMFHRRTRKTLSSVVLSAFCVLIVAACATDPAVPPEPTIEMERVTICTNEKPAESFRERLARLRARMAESIRRAEPLPDDVLEGEVVAPRGSIMTCATLTDSASVDSAASSPPLSSVVPDTSSTVPRRPHSPPSP